MDPNIDAAGQPSQPPRASVNNGEVQNAASEKRLSVLTQQPTKNVPGTLSPRVGSFHQNSAESPRQKTPASPLPLRRSPSNHSLDRKPSSPALNRKTSASSLRNGTDGSTTPKGLSSRRSSRNLGMSSPVSGETKVLPFLGKQEEEPLPLTAASVATDFFKKDLAAHQELDSTSDTVVILHDACYGHRFSRPKTSKSTLSMIVERPERIHAGIMGISAAYVRLGERHEGGAYAPHPSRRASTRFPFKIRRTSRTLSVTAPAVTAVHGTAWMQELHTMCEAAEMKLATTGKELVRGTDIGIPGQSEKAKLHEGDLYLCKESLSAFQGALGGVCDGVDAVFEGTQSGKGPSTAFVCVRPPGHHCSADYPSGFCWLNNVHVGIQHAAQSHGLTHAVILDFDLHHGDGSQSITWEHNEKMQRLPKNAPNSKKAAIAYFSLHDINSYPCEYGDVEKVQNASLCIENAHGQCVWNVHLQPWKNEAEFWSLYESRYSVLIEKARTFLQLHTARLSAAPNLPRPKAAIFLSSGFDASEWESQGMQRHKVNVPTEFYARFTRDVVHLSREAGTAVNGRIISVLEGGYSDRALMSGVFSHLSGLCTTAATEPESLDGLGLAYEMGQRLGALSLDDSAGARSETKSGTAAPAYNPSWWHPNELSALEMVVQPPPPPPKKTKPAGPANYSSLTQSFTAKVVDPSKVRVLSGVHRSTSPSREPTPPPPEVDWTIAVHELSKLLVPTDRQTTSCRPEELAEVRVKKDRQSIAVIPSVERGAGGRQLRDRKTRTPVLEEMPSQTGRSVSRSERRKTIADVPQSADSATPTMDSVSSVSERRRLSIASSTSSVNGASSSALPSSVSSRASSVKPPNGEIQPKKVRAPAASRAEPKPRPPPPRPSVQRVSSSAMNVKARTSRPDQGDSAVIKQEGKDAQEPMPSGVPGQAPEKKDASMDHLTGMIKKIRINVPTDEEYAEMQRKKAEEAEKKKSVAKPAPRKAPAVKNVKPTNAKKVAAPAMKATVPVAGTSVESQPGIVSKGPEVTANSLPLDSLGRDVEMEPPAAPSSTEIASRQALAPTTTEQESIPTARAAEHHKTSNSVPKVPSSRVTSPTRADTLPLSPLTESPTFIAYNPPGPILQSPSEAQQAGGAVNAMGEGDWSAAPAADAWAKALHWMPVNADVQGWTDEPPMMPGKAGDSQRPTPPVFTAHGVIPFAPNAAAQSAAAASAPSPKPSAGVAPLILPRGPVPKREEDAAGQDLWEVPDTPQKR